MLPLSQVATWSVKICVLTINKGKEIRVQTPRSLCQNPNLNGVLFLFVSIAFSTPPSIIHPICTGLESIYIARILSYLMAVI